jgi:hypothetical protein
VGDVKIEYTAARPRRVSVRPSKPCRGSRLAQGILGRRLTRHGSGRCEGNS